MLQRLRYSTNTVRDEVKRWAEFKQVGIAYFAGVDQNVDVETLSRATFSKHATPEHRIWTSVVVINPIKV